MKHVVGITATVALIVFCTVYPYLPGHYDSLAVPLSMLALLFGKVGLVLVPAGVLWAFPRTRTIALIATALVLAVMCVGAVAVSVAMGVVAIAAGAYFVMRMRTFPRAFALYLAIVPVAVALLQLALARPVSELGRGRAIRNSAPLIAAIEQYLAARGRYPPSLVSIHPDYKPSVIGIKRYEYDPSGDAYNLIFEQPSFVIGTQEFVVYNPRGGNTMTGHAIDILEFSPERLERARGYYASGDVAAHRGWKYFLFD